MFGMKIVAVIPCYNEIQTIAGVVVKAKKYCHRVIVVDNMSVDNTASEAERAGADIYKRYAKGAGAATGLGLAYSLNPHKDLWGDIMVTLDGDGQHDPDDIPKVVQPILDGIADVVIGSRFLGDYQIARYRKFGIDVITWLYNVGSRNGRIIDAQSCFRAFSRGALKKILPVRECGFGFSTEMLIKARKANLVIKEVPISCIYHKNFGMNSSMHPLVHGLSVALATVKWRLKCMS